MNYQTTDIEGVIIATPQVHEDERGFFMETYRADSFAALGITRPFVQENHSLSLARNTVRGFNFQFDPAMGKLMRVTRGAAFLVAVDLRKGSPTLGKWVGIEASAENKQQLYAPGPFARAFQTLTDDCEVQYLCDELYRKEGAAEIRFDDPDIGVAWPIAEQPMLSERNDKAPSFKEWLARPESDRFA